MIDGPSITAFIRTSHGLFLDIADIIFCLFLIDAVTIGARIISVYIRAWFT